MNTEFLEAYVTVLDYNGYIEDIKLLYEYIVLNKDKGKVLLLCDQLKTRWIKPDHPVWLLWSTLVVMYGGYGTSPRFGWIKDFEEAIKVLEPLYKMALESIESEKRL